MIALAIAFALGLLAALYGLLRERHDHTRTLQALRRAEGQAHVAQVELEVRGHHGL